MRFRFPHAVLAVTALFLAVPACRKDEPKPPPAAAPAPAPAPSPPPPAEPPPPEPPPVVEPPPRKAPATPREPLPPPEPPVNVVARGSSRTVELKWDASPGPNRPRGYEVLRGDAVVAKATGTSAKESGLENGREYCFTVRAVDATGRRSDPTAPACAYAWERDKPPAPTQLEATPLSVTEIAIAWKPLPKAMAAGGYEVRGGSSPIFAAEPPVRATGLTPGRRHCFTIFSLSPERKRGFPSEAVCASTPPDVTPPTTPGGLTAVALPGKIQLRWSASTDDAGVTAYEVLQDGALAGTVVELFALISEMTAGEHCYSVRAVDGSGNRSAPSAPACARPPDLSPPTRPTGVTVTAPKQDETVIRWSPATDDVGVARYEVLRDGKVVARRTTTDAREVGLQGVARYCYTVVAVDAAGNRSPASDEACTTTPDLTPPSRPGDLVVSVDGERVELRWGVSTDDVGVVGYDVIRGTQKVARVPGGERTYADVGPKPSAESCYVVRAVDAAGNLSPASIHACVKTPDRTAPSTPEGLVAAPGSSTRVSLSWAPSSDNVGVAGYEVLRDGQVIAQPIGTSTSVGGLQPRQEGCYAVRAFDVAGNRSRPSAPACARATDEDALPAPAGLEVTRAGADEVRLRWDPIPGADVTYLVYWDATRVSGGVSMKARTLGSTKLTTFKVFGPLARERRCYRVVARMGNRDSAETLPACVDAAPK